MREYLRRTVLENHVLISLIFVGLIWVLLEIRSILVILFVAYVLMASLAPIVEKLTALRIKRGFAILLVYLVLVSVFALIVFPLVPFFVQQLELLFINFPDYLGKTAVLLGVDPATLDLPGIVRAETDLIGQNALSVTYKIFGGFFSLISIFVLSLYLLSEKKPLQEGLGGLFGEKYRVKIGEMIRDVDAKLGAWLRGQIALSLIIGFATWVVLRLIGIPFALPLAVIAGILEAVPMVGPIISAVPAIIVAFTISPPLALLVAGGYTLIQQLENHIVVPRVMQQAVGLTPLTVIVSIMIGGSLLGITGALLAIPFASALTVIVSHIRRSGPGDV